MENFLHHAHRVTCQLIARAELVLGTLAASLFVWAIAWILVAIS
jgi:hypothetical protein